MAKKMLIDAAHPEETRVVVVNGNRIEEFDFEAAAKKPLKGNIYLAKVTRVEPSLQAAFVDFGGNRHGFLAFNEIHPDYYQIPVADRQRLMAAQQEPAETRSSADEAAREEPVDDEPADETSRAETADDSEGSFETAETARFDEAPSDAEPEGEGAETALREENSDNVAEPPPPAPPIAAGGAEDDLDDALEEARGRRFQHYGRPYKIHEVIKRRQILLVQVVKEERGNKGAALTTYLSLAGRYCVLMPNTARGGGISRKITQQTDRKRLKSAVNELEIPPGLGLIIRTAGANRTKVEIKRDYEYLLRVWENVRDLTLKSIAPALVYEEGNLIKRALRDLYSKEIDAILVDGEEGYKDAKTFMRTLMPSHAKVVQPYKDRIPLFQRYQVESLLDQMFQPVVHLRSGGYIVINQTEALVSIDVNSGRSTREHSIEETALRTNLEAADEAARQLRLRDLAGLIVIDFIDMEEGRNNRSVEKRLKDALKSDRARIQVGRISSFGLLEMSRQRLRAGVLEGSTNRCPHCEGSGIVRSVESQALRALRVIEEECLRDRTAKMTLRLPPSVALYILNYKRADIIELEQRYRTSCILDADDTLTASGFLLERNEAKEPGQVRPEPAAAVRFETAIESDEDEGFEDETPDEEAESGTEAAQDSSQDAEGRHRPETSEQDETGDRKRRRRRRRRGRRGDEARDGREGARQDSAPGPQERVEHAAPGEDLSDADGDEDEQDADEGSESDAQVTAREPSDDERGDGERGPRRRRRRGRRGGRRNQERGNGNGQAVGEQAAGSEAEFSAPDHAEGGRAELEFYGEDVTGSVDDVAAAPVSVPMEAPPPEPVLTAAPHLPHEPVPMPAAAEARERSVEPEPEPFPEPVSSAPVSSHAASSHAEPSHAEPSQAASPEPASSEPAGPPRRGWWQRRFGG